MDNGGGWKLSLGLCIGGRGPLLEMLEKLEPGTSNSSRIKPRSFAKPIKIFMSALSALLGSAIVWKKEIVRMNKLLRVCSSMNLLRNLCL